MGATTSEPKSIVKRRRRRRRTLSLDAEIRQSARHIYASGMAEAMKAAALVIAARKLDEVKSLLVASGLSSDAVPTTGVAAPQAAARPSPPPQAVANPCVQCGRPGIYKTRPNQFNRTGSWFCRTHMVLAGQIEAEDRMDRTLQPSPAPPPSTPPPESAAPAPGASSLAEAMGIAEVVDDRS